MNVKFLFAICMFVEYESRTDTKNRNKIDLKLKPVMNLIFFLWY